MREKSDQHYTKVTPIETVDSTDMLHFRALYIGGTGNLNILDAQGNDVTLVSVPVGILPINGQAVLSAATTVTGIVALY